MGSETVLEIQIDMNPECEKCGVDYNKYQWLIEGAELIISLRENGPLKYLEVQVGQQEPIDKMNKAFNLFKNALLK